MSTASVGPANLPESLLCQSETRPFSCDRTVTVDVITELPKSIRDNSYDEKESTFTPVFIFQMASDELIVAKLPFRLAEPPRFSTNSNVTIIKYSETEIPIPKMLGWSDDPSNPIGGEYISIC
ncbi:hypothetical protein COCC4DRAFT_162794 [Bipolaris maydis ATCC 48331]|uniref:Uncharacterized protein n=2 Tax=Cochliobolus heterostrophus TaxID=5016 RepID=M2T4M3_COCH5|nr:uncharacterized protein COCC4DRAFT_162794 [Bipolaris maydis ATCC 48331]EMD92525.1 hypothetical protein COCHEDRAFT_1203471 [Bipolaris maydis C5]KAJ5022345.1 hypothetical protein J3E73DRAFT_426972 [Bipolaris maydis]ENI08220.1 hypothetical protein COCC4DRAFT_162794 [Bipolaris maydis ATCC 48331]KAJ5061040.1 hypothetical protein J3E74DRAFT_474154 [Bipolaris maydis]KAJ6210306.1 hypothetical protein PSV09DRAFT_1203471 [Bipolaris maydis]